MQGGLAVGSVAPFPCSFPPGQLLCGFFTKRSPGEEWTTLELWGFSEVNTLSTAHFLFQNSLFFGARSCSLPELDDHRFLPNSYFMYFHLFAFTVSFQIGDVNQRS